MYAKFQILISSLKTIMYAKKIYNTEPEMACYKRIYTCKLHVAP